MAACAVAHGTASKPRAQNNTGGFLISWGMGFVLSRRGARVGAIGAEEGMPSQSPRSRIGIFFRGVLGGDGKVETGWLRWIGLAFRGQECQSDVIIRII